MRTDNTETKAVIKSRLLFEREDVKQALIAYAKLKGYHFEVGSLEIGLKFPCPHYRGRECYGKEDPTILSVEREGTQSAIW